MNENWANNMKQKLEGHQMVPPAGLWEGISRELNLDKVPTAKPAARRHWFWAGMAAVVLALVGFFFSYQQDESLPKSHPQAIRMRQREKPTAVREGSTENRQTALAALSKYSKPMGSIKKPVENTIEEEPKQPVFKPDTTAHDKASQQATTSKQAQHPAPSGAGNAAVTHDHPQQPVKSTSTRQWAIGLKASGGLLAFNQNRHKTSDLYAANIQSDPSSSGNTDNTPAIEQPPTHQAFTNNRTEAKHHLPVSLGLSLHYQLTPRLALLSGVNYTYLHTEFSIPYRHDTYTNQRLHYVGIPAGLLWQVWKPGGFSFYLSGSVMLQKCLNQKPWQWSIGIAAGAEYAITTQFGLYLEPSLGYYFNDGTSFDHYYKEHPLAPSIEFGLRLHLTDK